MKALPLLVACVCLLASCAKRPPNPGATYSPPTVNPLTEVERPSTALAVPLVRENSRALAAVRNENERLQDTVEASREANESLGGLLSASIEDGQATRERLLELKALANVERDLNVSLRISVEKQAVTITDLQDNSAKLEREVAALGNTIAVANQRLSDTIELLGGANNRIVSLTTAHNLAVLNAGEWKDAVATSEGRIEAESTWKWRFFWWAVVATTAIFGYTALRLHPATRLLIP